jgi:hypothetical protein
MFTVQSFGEEFVSWIFSVYIPILYTTVEKTEFKYGTFTGNCNYLEAPACFYSQ